MWSCLSPTYITYILTHVHNWPESDFFYYFCYWHYNSKPLKLQFWSYLWLFFALSRFSHMLSLINVTSTKALTFFSHSFQVLMISLSNCSNIFPMLSWFFTSIYSRSSYLLVTKELLLRHLHVIGPISSYCCKANQTYHICIILDTKSSAILLSPLFHSDILHYPLPTYLMSQRKLAICNFLSITFNHSPFFACAHDISYLNTQIFIFFPPRVILNAL